MKLNLFVVAFLFLPLLVLSQSGRQIKVGFGLDGISYVGDLSDPDQRIHRIYPGANLSIQVEGPKRLKLQLNGGFGKFAEQYDGVIPATDPTIRVNTFVETSFYYGDLRLKYRFPISTYFQPFLTAGAGVLVFSPKDENGRFLNGATFTREPGEEYSTAIPQIPVGAGIQTRLNRSLSMSLEYLFRYTPTDYLDNIGNLGNRPGHDFLHGLQLSLYITLSPPEEPTYPLNGSSYSHTNPNVVTEDSSVQQLSETNAATVDSATSEVPAMEEIVVEEAEVPVPVPAATEESSESDEAVVAETEVPVPVATEEISESSEAVAEQDTATQAEATDWVAMEEQAVAENRFVFYKVKKKDSLESISAIYKVRVETLEALNFLNGSEISKGMMLRIPDTGAVNQ